MSNRLRQLHLSLAAKCQLLFGAAVILIIAAALFVPWRRMEALTQQLNVRTARALVESAVSGHIARMQESAGARTPRSLPTTRLSETSLPTTRPTGQTFLPPHMILVDSIGDSTRATPFEQRAYTHFLRNAGDDAYWRDYSRADGTPGYLYARALYAEECAACHTPAVKPSPARAGTTRPAAAPARPQRLVGIVSVDIPSQIETNQLLLNRVFILSAGLLAGVLATIVFYLILTRLILQPVSVLQRTAERVSEGDLNIRSHIPTGDEFQQLSETFNAMLTNLKAGEDQLRTINKSLDLKLEQLAESNVALYESNRLKSEFLANVSHELRTPLNSILGFAELLRDGTTASADPKHARYLQNILGSGRNLLDLINDLLDLAKIEAGRMEVRSALLSLSDLFEGLSNILKPLLEAKTLSLNMSVAADVPIIQTDAAKLQQVLYNFLANAIKFSPSGAQVELIAQRQGEEHVRIAVTDHGPGIEPEKQELIFEKFRQIDGSVTREHSGTGLGLAISKELVLLLSGSIGVRASPGEGATFWVVLPLKIQAETRDVRKPATA